MKRLLYGFIFFACFDVAIAQQGVVIGPSSPCSAFGTSAGTCLQGAGALGSPLSIGTLPAFTLGGAISGGGNQVNNVIIGTTTPLAGSFTTLNSTGLASLSLGQFTGASFPSSGAGVEIFYNTGAGQIQAYDRGGAIFKTLILTGNGITLTPQGTFIITSLTQTSAAQSGTMCYNSGTGVVTYDATLGCLTSTMEMKENWTDISPDEALAKVVAMRPGSFNYKHDMGLPDGEQIGFNAEQMSTIDERFVSRDHAGKLRGVRYQQDSALYAGAIAKLKADNDNLWEEIKQIRSKLVQ